jgi:GAF domain-containing protein
MPSEVTLQERLAQLRNRREVAVQASGGAGHQPLLSFFVRTMPVLLDAELCSIFIHDPGQDKVWLQCATNMTTAHHIVVPRQGSIVGEVIRSGQPQIRTGLEQQPGIHKQVDSTTGFQTRQILCVPIHSLTRNHVIGAIQVLNKKSGAPFTDEDLIVVQEAASHLTMVIQNIFLQQEIARLRASH